MWVKNVFHKENEVSSIFTAAQTIGVTFVPNILQFVAHKSHFEKKDDVFLSQRIHDAIVTYVAKQWSHDQSYLGPVTISRPVTVEPRFNEPR